MFRKFVEFLDVREATDEEVAEYEAKFNPKQQQQQSPSVQQHSTTTIQPEGEEEDRLSEVSLGSNAANNNNNDEEFHAVSLSSPPNIDNNNSSIHVFSFENNRESPSFVAVKEGESSMFLQTAAAADAVSPLQEDSYYPERGDVIVMPPPPEQSVAPPLYHPQPIVPAPSSSSPSRPRRPSLESALAATPFRGGNKSVSFSSPFKPLIAASLPVPNFSTSPVPPPPAKTPSPVVPTIKVDTPMITITPAAAPQVFPKTPFPKSAVLPSTVKLPHNPPPCTTSSVLRLDDSLVDLLASENAHLNGDLDQVLLAWARNTPPTTTTTNNNNPAPPPQWNANSPPQQLQNNKDRLHAEQLAAKSQRIAALEQSLLDAERARVEKDRQIQQERAEYASNIAELNQRIHELSTKVALQDAQDLLLDFFKAPSASAATTNQDDLLKHCGKLARQFETAESAVAENPEAVHLSGKLVASLSAKVTLLEQQVQDEKLVLKNLFLSWMERAERKDAFEILASAFGFTQEDRERLNSKPSWKRASSLGVTWPFSESVADFVRDETS